MREESVSLSNLRDDWIEEVRSESEEPDRR